MANGTFTLSDGRIYEGQWKDNKMNGLAACMYAWPDGAKYEGRQNKWPWEKIQMTHLNIS